MSKAFSSLQTLAASLPGATIDIKWGADWVASVGGKMFLVGGPEPGPWSGCSFKVDEHRFLELSDLPGLKPAPYLARHHWIFVSDANALPLKDLEALVLRSHALVVAKLPAKLRKASGLA